MIFFLAPFLGYNFIKFHLFYWKAEVFKSSGLKFSIGFILLCYLLLGWVVFYLPLFSQLLFFCTLVLVLLYCLPLPGFKINLRGLKGLKIHLVALSWVFMTVFLPLSMEGKSITFFSGVLSTFYRSKFRKAAVQFDADFPPETVLLFELSLIHI